MRNAIRRIGVIVVVTLVAGLRDVSSAKPIMEAPFAAPATTAVAAADAAGSAPTFLGSAARTGQMPGPNPRTHAALWRFESAGGEFGAPPVVAGGLIYAASVNGTLYALDATTGEERWRFRAGAAIAGTPVVDGDVVIFLTSDGVALARDAATGAERWRVSVAPRTPSTPVVAEGTIYVTVTDSSGNDYLVALGDTVAAGPPAPAAGVPSATA